MKIIYGLRFSRRFVKPVVALGVFDGMHLGHRRLVRGALRKARALHGTCIVLTFWPHPRKTESLYSLSHRLKLMEELGVDVAIVLRFTREFALRGAEDFVREVLVGKLGVACVCVGKNFRFGRDARGTPAFLKKLARAHHFTVKVFEVVRKHGRRVSSSVIRSLISGGELAQASFLLGRPVSILGTVVKGDRVGRRLGYPTANIDPHHEVVPPSGIYAVKVLLHARALKGICYIGTKPTFGAGHKKVIEAHIFNFAQALYAKNIEIQFIRKIREDRAFATIPQLLQQIKKDIVSARTILQK